MPWVPSEPSVDHEVMTCRQCGAVVDILINLKCRACNPEAFKAHDAIQLTPRQLRDAANRPWEAK